MAYRPSERSMNGHHPLAFPSPFAQPTAQPPTQIPFSDPFQTSRDPFLPGPNGRRDSLGGPRRAWHIQAPGNGSGIPPPHHAISQHVSPPGPPLPPPPQHANGLGQMLPFDPLRRRSLGPAGSPPQFLGGPLEPPPPPPPPSFLARNMPPPSPPQMPPPAASAHLASAPRGPPITSPFAGVRDLPGFAPHRHGAGMTISSILGGDDRKPIGSPHSMITAPSSTPNTMPPPSPGRARASSMREGFGHREPSPPRSSMFGEPRAQSAFHERPAPDNRRGVFASPQFPRESPHSFRAFRPDQQEGRDPINGPIMLGRPSSQPTEQMAPRQVEEMLARRETPVEGRFGGFRQFGEAPPIERVPRKDVHPLSNGVTSQPREQRDVFGSPQMDRDVRYTPGRFPPSNFGTPMREDHAGLFRPIFQHGPDAARESIEPRTYPDMRREEPRSSPPISDLPPYLRARNGYPDRPMTFEEHQRMEAMQRDESRKGSDGSAARSLLGISPEFNRKGRNSPLPQAVQGAQPRFIGPGGDNPGIKMEFGRMFSGLGSGVGSATPTAGQSMNGVTTPSRLSPVRHGEDGDLVRSAVNGLDDGNIGSKAKGRRGGRRSPDEEKLDRATPDLQRGNKRTKTTHPAHHHHHHLHSHHHHHHHHEPEAQNGSFNTLRFPPAVAPPNPANSAHHHHHHHPATQGHPAHHHHHALKSEPSPRQPLVTVLSQALLEDVASKSRKHLGSRLYTTELSQPSNAGLTLDAKVKFSSKMTPIPCFGGRENCTYTVRVPRYYLAPSQQTSRDNEPSALEEVCKRRQLWGTDVYTDDSDVIAAAVHSGWIKGDFGDANVDLCDLCDKYSDAGGEEPSEAPLELISRPNKPAIAPADRDMHVTVLILPPLGSYASTMQHHVRSRDWNKSHDGMSFMIHRIDFVDEGPSTRYMERGIAARKQRLALEETKRREAAAGLLMFANGNAAGAVSVGA